MTVKELILELEKYDKDKKVYGYDLDEITFVRERLWMHTNYPYDRPDEMRLCIY